MSRTILLVDDDPDDAALFLIAAAEAGLARPIATAKSGEEALDLLLGRRLAPELIILDIKMPGLDGLEVLRRLRADAQYRDARIIILTSSDLERDREEARRLGCSVYLTKPSSLEGYIAMARRIKEVAEA